MTDQGTPIALVVDDNPLERFMAREALEVAGIGVRESDNGEGALNAFEQSTPDIVLLDVKMPRMDGFECCRQMRLLDTGCYVPILMLTGLDDIESINHAYEAGATDFFAKPIKTAVLTHRVRYLLRASSTAQALLRSQSQLAYAQRVAGLGYWEWRREVGLPRWSAKMETILGTPPEQVSAQSAQSALAPYIHADDRARFASALHRAVYDCCTVTLEHRIVRADGGVRIVHHAIEPGDVNEGAAQTLNGVVQDITTRRETEERIRYLAYFDSVTGLPNRESLKEQLALAIARAHREHSKLAVLFLDLDGFKRVNDTYGHNVGDQLLREVAQRLSDCTRGADYIASHREDGDEQVGPSADRDDTIVRLGGDEFVIVLSPIRVVEDAARVALRLREVLAQPFKLVDQDLYISTSIGISCYPADAQSVDALLKHADTAMYHAKATGRDRYQFFTAAMNERITRRLALETALREAIVSHQLLLHYQPIINAMTGRAESVEALVRWERPGHGIISPTEFISVAEETRLIVPLGDWVLRRACEDIAGLHAAGFDNLNVSVNLSAGQFSAPNMGTKVAQILADTGLDSTHLELELTETVLMEDVGESAAMLEELKGLGIQIAIDDFGTGYSSLAYLKRFPIDTLKIDRSFIRDIATDADDASIVAATIGLGKSLRLSLVGEGVETIEQLEFLLDHGCDRCQGFLLAKPMPLEALQQWLASETSGDAMSNPLLALRCN